MRKLVFAGIAVAALALAPAAGAFEGAIVSPAANICSGSSTSVQTGNTCVYTSTVGGSWMGVGPFHFVARRGNNGKIDVSVNCLLEEVCFSVIEPFNGGFIPLIPAGDTVTVTSDGGAAQVGNIP